MRFVYIIINEDRILSSRVKFDRSSDNLCTINSPDIEDAYFTCGDIALNYNAETGRIVSVDAYLPYWEQIRTKKIVWPKAIPGKLLLGDNTGNKIFNIPDLPLHLSADKTILHAGKGNSKDYIRISPFINIGLSKEQITDIYLMLDL